MDLLGKWMNTSIVEKNFNKSVVDNNGKAVRKLQSIQTFAYRLA
jgi:hypothetical protein